MTSRERKDFDAVAFKLRVQAQVSEEIKNLTPEEEIAYYCESAKSGPLADWWRSAQRSRAAGADRLA